MEGGVGMGSVHDSGPNMQKMLWVIRKEYSIELLQFVSTNLLLSPLFCGFVYWNSTAGLFYFLSRLSYDSPLVFTCTLHLCLHRADVFLGLVVQMVRMSVAVYTRASLLDFSALYLPYYCLFSHF
jgi:hypothetical protein